MRKQVGGKLIPNRGVREGLLEEVLFEQTPGDEWTLTRQGGVCESPAALRHWVQRRNRAVANMAAAQRLEVAGR